MRIVWDERKRLANIEKHGLDFAAVTFSVFDTNIVQDATHGRLKAIGYVEGRLVALIFKPLGAQAISLVSLRPASKQEKRLI